MPRLETVMQRRSQLLSRTKVALFPLTDREREKKKSFLSLTSVLLLHLQHQQRQVVVVGRQQGFNPGLLTGLVLRGKLVRPKPRLAPHQREGELLLGLAQLDGAALQNNEPDHVPVLRPILVEEDVSLQHAPALLIGGLYLTLCDSCDICGLLTHLLNVLHKGPAEISSLLQGQL